MAAPKGIVRYNRIRSELSKELKAQKIELEPWAFNAMSRDIFRTTKSDSYSRVEENIMTLAESMRGRAAVPLLPAEDCDTKEYWEVDSFAKEALPDDLWIVSPKIYGGEVKLSDYREEIHAKPMRDWVDDNRDNKGDDPNKLFKGSMDIPWIKITAGDFDKNLGGNPAIWNPKKLRWEVRLDFVDPSGNPKDEDGKYYDYGYKPGIEGTYEPGEIDAVRPDEEDMVAPEEVKPEKPKKAPKVDREIQLKKAETKLLKQQTRLEKAKGRAAKERTALVKELREIGYTKAEIKAELAKL